MTIQQQTSKAEKFTKQLAEFLVNSNVQDLNRGGKGCSIEKIDIYYEPLKTTISVKFSPSYGPIANFTCIASV
jgi:hypothetical protein